MLFNIVFKMMKFMMLMMTTTNDDNGLTMTMTIANDDDEDDDDDENFLFLYIIWRFFWERKKTIFDKSPFLEHPLLNDTQF